MTETRDVREALDLLITCAGMLKLASLQLDALASAPIADPTDRAQVEVHDACRRASELAMQAQEQLRAPCEAILSSGATQH